MPTPVKTIGNVEVSTGEGPFIVQSFIDAPFTEIQNREKIPNALKTSFGVERLHVNSLELKTKESGPNGEPVYGPDSGDDRIRFVGNWANGFDSIGLWLQGTGDGYLEITFYGTGLNLLGVVDSNLRDMRITVDGGSEAGSSFWQQGSDAIAARNYKTNQIQSVVSNLTLGWHTVKIRNIGTGARLYGFEIINTTDQITVLEGDAFSDGKKIEVGAAVIDYNAGFENVADIDVSSKGGRVITYVDASDSQVKKRLTNVAEDVLSGVELVTNGTFDTDISGWTDYGGASWNAGKLRVDGNAGTRIAEQAITTVVGQTYRLTADYDTISNPANNAAFIGIFTGAAATGTKLGDTNRVPGSGSGALEATFVATTTTTYLYVSVDDGNDIVDYDNISVQALTQGVRVLSATDHSEEAIYRKINWREFGRNRGDDFSTLSTSTSDRGFTLDDGTTTLVGDDVRGGDYNGYGDGIHSATNGATWTLTFVGTGLDFTFSNGGAARTFEMFVDGNSVGVVDPSGLDGVFTQKVCSGLPYGTHTVKFLAVGAALSMVAVYDFIIYQPKKPQLPEGSVGLTDYNLMADFVMETGAPTIDTVSQGVLSKSNTREIIYTGSWNALSSNIPVGYMGAGMSCNNGAREKITFFGKGAVWRGYEGSDEDNATLYIDGILATAANFPDVTFNYLGEAGFYDSSTATINKTSGIFLPIALEISGLPLGEHTIEIENSTTIHRIGRFDIITPIHSPNTTFGSLSMKDIRNFDSAKDVSGEIKDMEVFVNYSDSTGRVISSRGISQIVNLATGRHMVYFEEPSVSIGSQKIKAASSTEIIVSFINGSGTLAHTYSGLVFDTRQDNGSLEASAGNSINIAYKAQKDEFEE